MIPENCLHCYWYNMSDNPECGCDCKYGGQQTDPVFRCNSWCGILEVTEDIEMEFHVFSERIKFGYNVIFVKDDKAQGKLFDQESDPND